MKLSEDIVKELVSANLSELYNNFKMYTQDEKELYVKVRFGIRLKFDLNYYMHNLYVYKPKNEYVVLKNGLSFDFTEFFTELDEREALLREFFYKMYETDTTVAR